MVSLEEYTLASKPVYAVRHESADDK
jgi:hypothetical protein